MRRTWVLKAALVATIVGSLALPGWAESPKMKMTTEIPPGIASPDKVKTRLGTLRFFDGFPDNPTVDKLYDNLDFQRAVQAYLLGLAPVSQLANRKGILEVGPANKTVPIFEQIRTPGQCGQFGGCLFRSQASAGQGKQLGANHPRQGLEHDPAPLWPAGAVV